MSERAAPQILDELLVLGAQDGNEEAFTLLVGRYQARLLRHAFRLTGDHDAARDIAQEAWIAAAKSVRRLDDPAAFRAWLYQIVTRKCTDWVRRRQRERRLNQEWIESRPTEDNSAGQAEEQMRAALRRLSEEQRTLIALFYQDDLTVHEVARVLGIPTGTVKSRLFQARNELRDILEGTMS